MPDQLVSEELSRLFKALAHPERIRIIETIASEERNVSELQEAIEAPQSRVSQHLAKLRAVRAVAERRVGQQHFYRLRDPQLARWIVTAIRFVDDERRASRLHEAIDEVRERWGAAGTPPASAQAG